MRRPGWSPDEIERFIAAYEAGVPERELLAMFPGRTRNAFAGRIIRLQLKRPIRAGAKILGAKVRAVVEGRTLFPTRVRAIADARDVLTPGEWQKKLGKAVTKGAWAGMPIYALTLEERATCPGSCHHWCSCMGNGMPLSWRHRHGPELEAAINAELALLQQRHPNGFVVRLHILGDFYSPAYVRCWARWLNRYPALHVFGYTAWVPSTPIGTAVARLSRARWSRFAIRLSSPVPGPGRAITVWEWPTDLSQLNSSEKVIVCPAELGKTKGCNSCGLCWSPAARDKTIAFIAHGGARR